jgi:hypothetical protein
MLFILHVASSKSEFHPEILNNLLQLLFIKVRRESEQGVRGARATI